MANSEYVEVFNSGAVAIDRWRTENTDVKPDLSGADLRGADLTETNLVGADLSGANLVGADLSGADLVGANLVGANLEQADLCFADLSGTDLSWANLHRANLRQAIFNGAHSRNTLWVEVDLSRAVELETVIHWGPSSLGVNTILNSKGKIPVEFLRGCGLPDDLIARFPDTFSDTTSECSSCFICFSPEDKAFALKLYETLQARGIRCWLDEKQSLAGASTPTDRGLKIWDKVLLCASKHSLTSDWVNQEIEIALENEDRQYKRDTDVIRSLLPLNLDQHLFDHWEHQNKQALCDRVAADFKGWETDQTTFDSQVERVITALQTDHFGGAPV
ncbi:toll/interleukin-1 receptor domain-containing protein [Gimesia fumaroli]|uniref:Secreted effector protein PipB n=1 Tax=Gimesia fumaroli TaxID=2527976 RepID=A0A518I6X7_9PLAN|nr:toll/interleukin-1 receptor domain-containing protein [Gimesia fumaroli]QDV48833.1 Secreted effector protein PipB [Gimesia fumaroli]